MFSNNYNKNGSLPVTSRFSFDAFSDSSLENSFVDNLNCFKLNKSYNTTSEKQTEKNKIDDEDLRRKDSAIELEDIKNSFSETEFSKSKNVKLSAHDPNKKVEFIVDDEDSSEEGSTEENEDIFNLEIESQIKNHQNHSPILSSYHVPDVKTNQNLSLTQNVKKLNINDINCNNSPNLFYQKMVCHHLSNNNINNSKKVFSPSSKTSKIRFENNSKELKLKSSPMKYSGLDILKPILKKKSSYTSFSEKEEKLNCINLISDHNQNRVLKQKKSVHFKSENEECPFKKIECPSNIVNLPIYVVDSRLEPFLESKLIRLEGLSKKKAQLPWNKNVILESVGLIDDEKQEHDILRLTIQVRNLAFEKYVKVHYTFDNWENVEIGQARYRNTETNLSGHVIDKFILDIDTDCDGESICNVQFAIQYQVNKQEFWDNNNGHNYVLKVDRTVRIPAKAIKSHRYCEGPVVRYKLKPGYHYPLFKSNLKEHPSAEIPLEESLNENSSHHQGEEKKENFEEVNEKENGECIEEVKNNYSSFNSSLTTSPSTSSSSNKVGIDNSRFSVERNINENENTLPIGNISSEWNEEEKEDLFEKEVFSWNEPILLRKPSTFLEMQNKYYPQHFNPKECIHSKNDSLNHDSKDKVEKEEKKSTSKNSIVSSSTNLDTNIPKNKSLIASNLASSNKTLSPTVTTSNNSNSNNNSSNDNISNSTNNLSMRSNDNDKKYPLENTFLLPKHENWFKEAPQCIPFGSSPRKLYHHSNNFKLNHSLSKSLFNSKSKNQVITEKDSSKGMKNKCNESKYRLYDQPPTSSTSNQQNCMNSKNIEKNDINSNNQNDTNNNINNNNNYHNYNTFNKNINYNSNCSNPYDPNHKYCIDGNRQYNYNVNDNQFTQNYLKPFISSVNHSPYQKSYSLYSNSHLYATQDDFISDNIAYF